MKVGFIGCGNMGGAILGGAVGSGFLQAENTFVSDPSEAAVKRCAQQYGVTPAADNVSLAQAVDLVILCVKPIYLRAVIEEIAPHLAGKAALSIAAGWTFQKLRDAFAPYTPALMRVMPNTPALVGAGYTAICEETTFPPALQSFALSLFQTLGIARVLPERLFDGVVAASGSSPAYLFMVLEAMGDGAVREGVPRALAYEMAAQAMLGSAKMLLETKKHPGELKDMVCSPAGTTIEAVAALEAGGLRACLMDAMQACADKCREMNQ